MVYPSIDPRLGDYTFEEIVTQVHHYMRYYINSKFLRGDITTNASTQRNPLIRIVPLFLKDFVVRQFYQRVQDKKFLCRSDQHGRNPRSGRYEALSGALRYLYGNPVFPAHQLRHCQL